MRRLMGIMMMILCMLGITGCWDKVEIDKRAFIGMIGIDKYIKEEDNKAADNQRNRYTVTFAYPNTGLIAGKGEGKAQFPITSTGENLYDIERAICTRFGGSLYFGHVKGVIIGKELASDEKLMREVLDVLERSPEIGRKVHFMITPEKTKDVLNVTPESQPVLGLFLRDLMEQQWRSARIADADIGYILRSLHESRTAIVPRIICSDKEIKVAGSAILKDYKMAGWLGEIETKYAMYLLDKIDTTEMNLEVDDLVIPLAISDVKTKKKVYKKDNQFYVDFDVTGEGDLAQHLFAMKGRPLDKEYLERIEKITSKKIEEEMKAVYKKIYKEFQGDLIQSNEYLRKHEPELWKEVKDHWDEIFPNMKMNVHAEIKIRRVGVTK